MRQLSETREFDTVFVTTFLFLCIVTLRGYVALYCGLKSYLNVMMYTHEYPVNIQVRHV